MNQSERIAQLWTKAYPTVAGYVSSVVTDFHEAEDLLQSVAVAVVRKFDTYDTTRPFTAWAVGIARTEVLRHRRQRATDKHVFADDLVECVAAAYEQMADELDDRRWALAECLQRVAGRSRRALRLRYVENLKPSAMAPRMDMTVGAVRVLLHRIREALRQCIEHRLAPGEEP